MRRVTIAATALVLGCLSPPPPSLTSFPARMGAVLEEDCCGKPLEETKPKYPAAVAARGPSGWVIVSGILDSRGFVTDPIVLASDPAEIFDRAAIEAFDQWRYEAPRDSKPREVRAMLRFRVNRPAAAIPSGSPAGGGGGGGGGY